MPNGTVSTNTVASISGTTITVVGNFVQKIQDSNNNTDNYFLSTTNNSYNFNEQDYILTTQTIAPNLNSIWILETTQGTSAENIETQIKETGPTTASPHFSSCTQLHDTNGGTSEKEGQMEREKHPI